MNDYLHIFEVFENLTDYGKNTFWSHKEERAYC